MRATLNCIPLIYIVRLVLGSIALALSQSNLFAYRKTQHVPIMFTDFKGGYDKHSMRDSASGCELHLCVFKPHWRSLVAHTKWL